MPYRLSLIFCLALVGNLPAVELPGTLPAGHPAIQPATLPTSSPTGSPTTQPSAGRDHWSYQPIGKIQPPATNDPSWIRSPIDAFVLAKLQDKGLRPVALADKRVLIRRATFDLTGLPPTPAEVSEFVADNAPDAFARLIDRLLDSEEYGRRWGRHWLDLARYADTAGDTSDFPVPEAALYRDYVVDAFNHDKPYDQFLKEQIAGDILADRPGVSAEHFSEQVVATGFIAESRRFGPGMGAEKQLVIADTIDTIGQSMLGLTLGCARCHDHKFDAITRQDYYGLYGYFQSTLYPHPGSEESYVPADFVALTPDKGARDAQHHYEHTLNTLQHELLTTTRQGFLIEAAKLEPQIKQLEEQLAAMKDPKPSPDKKPDPPEKRLIEMSSLEQQLAELISKHADLLLQQSIKLTELKQQLADFKKNNHPYEQLAYAVQEGKPEDAHIQLKGDPMTLGDVAPRGFIRVIAGNRKPEIPAGGSGRLQLAEWIASAENPLTARVMANRLWLYHFGRGIVDTPNNFGVQGTPPSHPELLDYLASQFIESGWSIKAMHRLIMLSTTYQLASSSDDVDLAKDPGNIYHWRFERQRLDAESFRDAILAVSGTLDRSTPGPHPFPPKDKWRYTQHEPFKAVYPSNHRSLYLMTQRIVKNPFLELFDGPDTSVSTPIRRVSTVPLQSLFLMNSDFLREQAGYLARRVLGETSDERQRLRSAAQLTWSRDLSDDEVQTASTALTAMRQSYRSHGASLADADLRAWSSYMRVLLSSNEFAYVD